MHFNSERIWSFFWVYKTYLPIGGFIFLASLRTKRKVCLCGDFPPNNENQDETSLEACFFPKTVRGMSLQTFLILIFIILKKISTQKYFYLCSGWWILLISMSGTLLFSILRHFWKWKQWPLVSTKNIFTVSFLQVLGQPLMGDNLLSFVGNKAKGQISKRVLKKTKYAKFSEKRTFITPLLNANTAIQMPLDSMKRCSSVVDLQKTLHG